MIEIKTIGSQGLELEAAVDMFRSDLYEKGTDYCNTAVIAVNKLLTQD
jgi:hypothetical protein